MTLLSAPVSPLERYKSIWESALVLSGYSDLTRSAIQELSVYFPSLDKSTITTRFDQSEELFAHHWYQQNPNPSSEEDLIRFYNETELEILELMHYHSVKWDQGPQNYVCALLVAQQLNARTYMDYGSGVGSGGLLFTQAGFQATLCDISTPLLKFARWRFAQRGLEAKFTDLKESTPTGQVDIITCFEVLEHVRDPLALLRKLHRYLNAGGLLIVTAPFWKDEERPMHIVHDIRLTQRFRAQGYQIRRDLKAQFSSFVHEPFFILQKVQRPRLLNALVGIYDCHLPEPIRVVIYRTLKILAPRLLC